MIDLKFQNCMPHIYNCLKNVKGWNLYLLSNLIISIHQFFSKASKKIMNNIYIDGEKMAFTV
jgi:hypothetical protein